MNRFFFLVVLVTLVSVTALLMALPVPPSESGARASGDGVPVLVMNAFVADRNGERTTASILMQDGYIRSIGDIEPPADVTVIDGSGLTAIAGLIDSHTHSYDTSLKDALRFGVTTNVDMFSAPTMLSTTRSARDVLSATTESDLFSAGNLATAPGGHGTQFGIPVDTLSAPSDADAFVTDRVGEGSDFIKLVYMPDQSRIPSLDRATAKAVIDSAHKQGLMAVAHISTQRAAFDMVEDGIDGLVHVFADERVSDEFIEHAKASDVFVVPTLAVIASVTGRAASVANWPETDEYLSPMQKQSLANEFPPIGPGFDFDIALHNVGRLHEAGVIVLAGSDAPNPGTAHGVSLHHELELLVQAGLTPTEAVRSATQLPAQIFDMGKRGVVAEGFRADLLLVRGNPYQNVRASRAIDLIFKNGYAVEREKYTPESVPAISTPVLGSFDDSFIGPDDLIWDATVDAVAGGRSTAEISRVPRSGGGYALSVRADVKPGFAWPWAGVGLSSADVNKPIDVSQYANIVFDVKGTPGTYRLMLFSGAAPGAPPTREFTVSKEWQTITLSLDEFGGFEPKAFSMLGIVAGPKPSSVEFLIDEVRFQL